MNLFTVFITIIIGMIYRQKIDILFSATDAFTPIFFHDSDLKIRVSFIHSEVLRDTTFIAEYQTTTFVYWSKTLLTDFLYFHILITILTQPSLFSQHKKNI